MNTKNLKRFLLIKLILSVIFLFVIIAVFYFAVYRPISSVAGSLG